MNTTTYKFQNFLHEYAENEERSWVHDRGHSVGGSEVFQCARRVVFDKTGTPRDDSYDDDYGARKRGQLLEDNWIVPALQKTLPEGLSLHLAGDDQRTLRHDFLTVTPDGLIVNETDNPVTISDIGLAPGECMVVEFKTIDPRVSLEQPKPEHEGQVQAEMGIIKAQTNWSPVAGLLIYVDASFISTVHEFKILPKDEVYSIAVERAEIIMHADDPMRMKPEGKIAGGRECGYCPWAARCGQASAESIPANEKTITDAQKATMGMYIGQERVAREKLERAKTEHAAAQEQIKAGLKDLDTNRVRLDDYTVSFSPVAGRVTLDRKAMEADGLDLSQYEKVGCASERLTIKVNK